MHSFLKHNMTFMMGTNLEPLTGAPSKILPNAQLNQEDELKDSKYLKRPAPQIQICWFSFHKVWYFIHV